MYYVLVINMKTICVYLKRFIIDRSIDLSMYRFSDKSIDL